MVKKIKILALILLTQLNTQCQMMEQTPEFDVEITHPNPKYLITPVFDYIKTLEGTPAGLPYGSSSGNWASSGKSWTAQKGTPIGFEITYYSEYEDKYYYINQDFDLKEIQEMTNRCYPWMDERLDEPVKEYLPKVEYDSDFEKYRYVYAPFGRIIFGFAPQGMVVVWCGYGPNRIELGRYQAIEVTDEKRLAICKEKYLSTYRVDESIYDEQRKKYFLPNASPELWDNYRKRYNWSYKVASENAGFRFFEFEIESYNGEIISNFAPYILNPKMQSRAIPSFVMICWETSAKERFLSRVFFNWEKTNELLKNAGENNTFQFHINKQNSEIEVLLNNNPIEVDSVRIYPSHLRFRDSYED